MNLLTKLWSVIEKNRWTTIVPTIGIIVWLVVSFSCVPQTESPIRVGVKVNAKELQQDFETWKTNNELIAKKFQYAGEDITEQQERWNKFTGILMKVATGNVTNFQGLLNIVLGSGLLGVSADNLRKNGVIAGLKRNTSTKKKRS